MPNAHWFLIALDVAAFKLFHMDSCFETNRETFKWCEEFVELFKIFSHRRDVIEVKTFKVPPQEINECGSNMLFNIERFQRFEIEGSEWENM